jgi:formate dehydrogenase accessory protein FdhE
MIDWWTKQIQRAETLAKESQGTSELLSFYAQLLRCQKEIYEAFRSRRDWLPSGDLTADLCVVREALQPLLRMVEAHGPEPLVAEARKLSAACAEEIDALLVDYWHAPADTEFFAKALSQPYARWLAETGTRPIGRNGPSRENRCPFCGGRPQVSFLQSKEPSAESGNRDLICANCLSVWPFRRVVCANCGEERPAKLGYFQAPEYDHVRVEACDTCGHYLKGVDLTRLGFAAPLVDEVAAAPLDLWAREQGYTKMELNLVGL